MSLLMRDTMSPSRRARVEARRQPLQVPVQRQPHVEQDLRRHARVAQPADDVQREADERQRGEQRRRCDSSAVEVAAEQRAVEEVAATDTAAYSESAVLDQAEREH